MIHSFDHYNLSYICDVIKKRKNHVILINRLRNFLNRSWNCFHQRIKECKPIALNEQIVVIILK